MLRACVDRAISRAIEIQPCDLAYSVRRFVQLVYCPVKPNRETDTKSDLLTCWEVSVCLGLEEIFR